MGNWRAFLVRHALGRLHIGEEIVRHLSTFQRLGETLEVAPPSEMLPVGARTLFRAIRTRAAVQIRPDWLWARWLERQLDPADDAFTPRGHLPVMQNVTQRNWTMVGNVHSPWEAIVDGTGLVTPWFDGWSLDWWVQARGEWHLPTRAPQLRQSLLGSAPIVVTELPLEAGTVIQRVYTVAGPDELVVVEVSNATDEPLSLALAVRPYNPEGLAVVERIEVNGRHVAVDGHDAVLLEQTPLGVALGSFATGDSLRAAELGAWRRPDGVGVRDPAGLAQAAVLLDLPARGTVRAATPINAAAARAHTRPHLRRFHITERGTLPSSRIVAGEWEERLERGLHVELPDERLQRAVDANRAFLLVLHDPGDITAGPYTYHRFWFRDAAYQVAALDRWGFAAEATDVLRTYPGRQQVDGFYYSQWREWDANGAAIWTIAEHHRLTGDEALLAELAPSVAKGAAWIARTCAATRGKAAGARGLLPAGVSAEHLGPFDYYYWDNLWAWRGLLDAAAIARWRADDDAASRFEAAAKQLESDLFRSVAVAADRIGCTAIPAGPTRGVDAGMIGSLAACYPLGLLPASDAWMRGTADVVRERLCRGEAFYQGISHTGLGTYLTLQLAFVELEDGDPRAWRRFAWLLDAATPTFTWPEAIHPQLPGGCMGDGHHGWMAADLLNFVRLLLVRETPDGLALLSVLPPEWVGERVAVRSAPTHHGTLDFELTWEDDVAVLRWRCTKGGVRLTAPFLAPSWASTERTGEARFPDAAVRSGGDGSRAGAAPSS